VIPRVTAATAIMVLPKGVHAALDEAKLTSKPEKAVGFSVSLDPTFNADELANDSK
jgi:hypothetical protein